MKKVAIDYKGKHFIIQDEDMIHEMDTINPYVDAEKVIAENLESHVADCMYYGIPAYIGKDTELKQKIQEIENVLNK